MKPLREKLDESILPVGVGNQALNKPVQDSFVKQNKTSPFGASRSQNLAF